MIQRVLSDAFSADGALLVGAGGFLRALFSIAPKLLAAGHKDARPHSVSQGCVKNIQIGDFV